MIAVIIFLLIGAFASGTIMSALNRMVDVAADETEKAEAMQKDDHDHQIAHNTKNSSDRAVFCLTVAALFSMITMSIVY